MPSLMGVECVEYSELSVIIEVSLIWRACVIGYRVPRCVGWSPGGEDTSPPGTGAVQQTTSARHRQAVPPAGEAATEDRPQAK